MNSKHPRQYQLHANNARVQTNRQASVANECAKAACLTAYAVTSRPWSETCLAATIVFANSRTVRSTSSAFLGSPRDPASMGRLIRLHLFHIPIVAMT